MQSAYRNGSSGILYRPISKNVSQPLIDLEEYSTEIKQ